MATRLFDVRTSLASVSRNRLTKRCSRRRKERAAADAQARWADSLKFKFPKTSGTPGGSAL